VACRGVVHLEEDRGFWTDFELRGSGGKFRAGVVILKGIFACLLKPEKNIDTVRRDCTDLTEIIITAFPSVAPSAGIILVWWNPSPSQFWKVKPSRWLRLSITKPHDFRVFMTH
jgi:hypothetical protein